MVQSNKMVQAKRLICMTLMLGMCINMHGVAWFNASSVRSSLSTYTNSIKRLAHQVPGIARSMLSYTRVHPQKVGICAAGGVLLGALTWFAGKKLIAMSRSSSLLEKVKKDLADAVQKNGTIDEQLKRLTKQIEQEKEQSKAVLAKLANATQETTDLNEQLGALQADKGQVDQDLVAARAGLQERDEAMRQLREVQMQALNDQLAQVRDVQLPDLNLRLVQARQNVDAANAQAAAVTAARDGLQAQYEGQVAQIQGLTVQVVGLQQNVADANAQVAEALRVRDQAQAQHAAQVEQIRGLEGQVEEARRQHDVLRHENDRLHAELHELGENLKSLHAQQDETSKRAAQALLALEQRKEELKRELDECRSEPSKYAAIMANFAVSILPELEVKATELIETNRQLKSALNSEQEAYKKLHAEVMASQIMPQNEGEELNEKDEKPRQPVSALESLSYAFPDQQAGGTSNAAALNQARIDASNSAPQPAACSPMAELASQSTVSPFTHKPSSVRGQMIDQIQKYNNKRLEDLRASAIKVEQSRVGAQLQQSRTGGQLQKSLAPFLVQLQNLKRVQPRSVDKEAAVVPANDNLLINCPLLEKCKHMVQSGQMDQGLAESVIKQWEATASYMAREGTANVLVEAAGQNRLEKRAATGFAADNAPKWVPKFNEEQTNATMARFAVMRAALSDSIREGQQALQESGWGNWQEDQKDA